MANQPNIQQPTQGPTWLSNYTRSIEREIKRAIDNAPAKPSRAKGSFLYG